jgi:murein endopeptidase
MELKTARLTVLVDPAKKKAFEALCARQDVTPSQVVRRLIRDYLAHHGVGWVLLTCPAGSRWTRRRPRSAERGGSGEHRIQ